MKELVLIPRSEQRYSIRSLQQSPPERAWGFLSVAKLLIFIVRD